MIEMASTRAMTSSDRNVGMWYHSAMIISRWYHIDTFVSLLVIALVLVASVLFSLQRSRREIYIDTPHDEMAPPFDER